MPAALCGRRFFRSANPSKARRTRPRFAHFPVSGTKKRRSPQCRMKFFSGVHGAPGTPSPRPGDAIEMARDVFWKLARRFFKALFREGQTRSVARVEFRHGRRGYADDRRRHPALEIISAKLLTSRFPVISFRPSRCQLRMRVIRNEPTTRVTKRNSTRELNTVDQGNHPSAKRVSGIRKTRLSNARTGLGPGVFIPGAGMRRTLPVLRASSAAAVRRGNPPVAVPL